MRPRPLLAILAAAAAPVLCGSYRGFDAEAIARLVEGRRLVLQCGCPETPRLDQGSAPVYAMQTGGASESDTAFRARVTRAFLDGLARASMGRVAFDSSACRTGPASRLIAGPRGHALLVDSSRLHDGDPILALGLFQFRRAIQTERGRASLAIAPGGDPGLVASMPFGIYDPATRDFVYADHEEANGVAPNATVLRPEIWENAARRLGEEIGEDLARLPGR